MSSVAVKSIDWEHVRRRMDEYAADLFSTRQEIEEIIVFGSFERGNYAPGSDLDVLLVLGGSPKPVWERIPEYLPGAFPVGLDLFPYTRAELAGLSPSPILDAVRESRWRYRRVA